MTVHGGGPGQEREPIAIVGMTGRFPGAPSVDDLWRVLLEGRETLQRFSPEELCPSVPAQVRSHPDFVPVAGVLGNADHFDAEYFQVTPREAEIMDPQLRLLLEAGVHALEDAGIDPRRYSGDIAVYCGKGANEYLAHNVLPHGELVEAYGETPTAIASEKDFVATRMAYELDLRGPAVSVNTACSTSLVAVSLAVDALRLRRCDVALAGAASVRSPQERGGLSGEAGHAPADGHVRPFDQRASGTVFSSGLGLVVLKRLDDALRDRDAIRAVILGVGTNSSGAAPRSVTGPSVEGQEQALRRGLADAGVPARSIDYVEAHGTAAPESDTAELAALRRVFGEGGDGRAYCALGALKSNLGHLGAASGVAGLIKVALCLEHERVAPTIHCEEPDPALDPEHGPFFLANKPLSWPRGKGGRRAGVSAFGIGGTNAHLVVEEAPVPEASGPSRPVQLIVHSARSGAALDRATDRLAAWLGERADDMAPNELADVAYTLQSGRTAHTHRRFAQGENARELARALHDGSADRVMTATIPATPPRVAFVFPGQGAQYVNMGSGLYSVEPRFREIVDECAELLRPHLDFDVREVLLASDVTTRHLRQTRLAQPAVFVVEYSLARLWQAWGVEPDVLVGHSVGQYVAACVAGVLSLPDALAVVARRSTLMQELPPGIMISTRLPESELTPLLGEGVSLAAVNAPELCVASGPEESIEQLARTLKARDVSCRRLDTSHAFHSSMMEPMIEPFTEFMSGVELSPPRVPLLCTTSGQALRDEDACDPAYWAGHVREPVRFSAAVRTLWEAENRVVLEVGPGRMMATLARQQLSRPATQFVISSLLENPDARSECGALQHAVGRLWLHGVEIDWAAVHGGERRNTVPLPGYSFEPTRHWLSPPSAEASPTPASKPRSAVGPSRRRATPAGVRRDEIAARVRTSLQAASGVAPDVTPTSLSFLELGLDSLFLTHWARSLRETFGVPVSVRQLLDTEQTLEALVTYIVQHTKAVASEASEGANADQLSRRLDDLTHRLERLGDSAMPEPGMNGTAAAEHERGEPAPARPPLPGARVGRTADGLRAWFVPDPARPGRYLQVDVESESES